MKFYQLIEYNMRTFFLKNHTQNVVKKLFPDPFLKNRNWVYLWINSVKPQTVCFYCMPSCGISIYIGTKLHTRPLACTSYKALLKNKRHLELFSMLHFLHDFWRKSFLLVYSINWPIFILWLSLLREILVNKCIAIVC